MHPVLILALYGSALCCLAGRLVAVILDRSRSFASRTDPRFSVYKSAVMWWRSSIFSVNTPNGAFFRASSKKPTTPSSTDGMEWGRDYFYGLPQLQGSRPKQRFAQIRPVTSGCGWSSHPSPQAELRTNATSGVPSLRVHPPLPAVIHESRLFLQVGLGKYKIEFSDRVILHVKWFDNVKRRRKYRPMAQCRPLPVPASGPAPLSIAPSPMTLHEHI